MYFAFGDKVFLKRVHDEGELFLTVHPTEDSTKTVEEQALIIAEILNKNT